MKTRIISGVIMGVLVAGLLALSTVWTPVIYIGLALCAGAAAYELLWKTGAVKTITAVVAAVSYMALSVFCGLAAGDAPVYYLLTSIFVAAMIVIALARHEKLPATSFGYAIGIPIAASAAFCALADVIAMEKGILLFLFVFNFASIADIGAYFVGSAIGKHKLAPVLSPKKSIEGAVGGMVFSMIFTVIFVLCFNRFFDTSLVLWQWLAVTPVFVAVGICGDLIASYIKRSFGIKDYSNLIPGHGGIMDRLDSILLVAPFFKLFLSLIGGKI